MTKSYQAGSLIAERWEVHKVLGGGMGVVYIVYDQTLKEAFALKTYRDEVFQRAPEAADRFHQEALTWINLDVHANIAQARLVTTIDGKPYIVLEYVSGGDLEARIGKPELVDNSPLILRFALQFCDGMIHAASKGVKAHRDIKPQNCLIADGENLKITDFGLAKVLDVGARASGPTSAVVDGPVWSTFSGTLSFLNSKISAASMESALDLTRTGMGAGTCTHMAPEQFADAKRVDVKADVYSFGVMLFQMVTGRLPFQGRTWRELETLHKSQSPPALTGALAGVLNPIVQGCLSKDPSDRFSDFSMLRLALADVFNKVVGKPAPAPVTGSALQVFHLSNKAVSLCNLGRVKEGLACFDQALRIDPDSATVWYNKGVYLGKTEEALSCYQEALRIVEATDRSGDGGWWEFRLEQAWFNMAAVLEELGEAEAAIECYDQALSLNPRYEKGLIGKGSCLASLGKGDEALRCFDDALEVNPRSVGALASKGVAVSELGCLDEALSLLSAAVDADPECVMALYNKGLILGKLGRNEEELSCYDQALSVNSRHAMCWYNKGLALGELGRPEEEIACYDRAVDCDPNHWQARFNKGSALVELHRYEEAIQSFVAARRLGAEEAGERIEFCRWAMNRNRH